MGKVTGDISNFRFPNACKIGLRAFIEAGTFIRIDGETRRLPAYFDNPADGREVCNLITQVHGFMLGTFSVLFCNCLSYNNPS